MEYFAIFGTETTLFYVGSILALAGVGAVLQAKWRRTGPVVALALVIAATLTFVTRAWGPQWAAGSTGQTWGSVTAAVLWVALPPVGAFFGLFVFSKASRLARFLGAVACGIVVAVIAPYVALAVGCFLNRGDCL